MKTCCCTAIKLNLVIAHWSWEVGEKHASGHRGWHLMLRQKCHWILRYLIPLLTAQEHTFPAHVWGKPSKLFQDKWLWFSFCLKMQESCFTVQCCGKQGRGEGSLGKADVASPLTTWLHTLQWLLLITVDDYFTSIAACAWTLGVLHFRGNLNASIHFVKKLLWC